jgi:hypothetical protein
MSSLKTGQVNTTISKQLINTTIDIVKNNHSIDKSLPSEKYYCPAIIESSSINMENATCTLLLVDTDISTILYCREKFKLSFLPKELVRNAKGVPLIHVLVSLKLFYYSTIDSIEVNLIIPIGEEIGYFHNEIEHTPDCIKMFCDFYKKRKDSWNNSISLPSYRTLSEVEDSMIKVVRLLSA